ncbi:WXG100 family type VII secretion target [Streptomyces fractus]|uniref:WXG100 family type VII secretion target n=1 Tax=Streptomyces fractus TaxID=641806 RepID=UPI003CED7DE4
MGDHFKVEVDELDQLIRQLHQSQDSMRKALSSMRDTGPKSTGSKSLDNACDEFHDSWDDAITKIADGTQQIEDKLRTTKSNYQATEEAIRDAMSKGATPSAQPSPTPLSPSSSTPSASPSSPSPTPAPTPPGGRP